MKAMEDKLRDAYEKAHKSSERIKTLPSTE